MSNISIHQNLVKSFAFLLAVFIMPACTPQEICSDTDKSFIISGELGTKIDQTILNEEVIPFSGSICIMVKNDVLLKKSYSLTKGNKSCFINPYYSYWVASLSKQFTAAAILMLQQEGKVNVHDPISNYFSDLPPDKKDITVHQLLTHTSGLPDQYAADNKSNLEEALKSILRQNKLKNNEYSYSNDGYQLLAILIEKLTGLTYEQFIAKRVFEPFDMKHSGNSGDQQKNFKLEVASAGIGADHKINGNPQFWKKNYGYKGATGILSNPDDLLKWHMALHTHKVLNPEYTELLFARHVLKDKANEIYYGYGWNIFNTINGKVIVHSGGDDFIAHTSTYRYYPERELLLIITANAGYIKGKNIAQEMANKILDLLL